MVQEHKYIYLIDDHEMILEGLQSYLKDKSPWQLLPFSSPKQALIKLIEIMINPRGHLKEILITQSR